jgi:hypothetical protein
MTNGLKGAIADEQLHVQLEEGLCLKRRSP